MKKLMDQSGLALAIAMMISAQRSIHSNPIRHYSSNVPNLAKEIREYKLIQAKKSKLSASQRAYIVSKIQKALEKGYITQNNLN